MFNNQTAQDAQHNRHAGFDRKCGGFFGKKMGENAPWKHKFANAFGNRIPANIEEKDEAYYLHLYAAGLVKENITLSVKNDVLSIVYKAAQSTDSKFTYQEYTANDFERLFQLNNNVLTENISAAYADGVLKVTLPKNPETTKPAQKVTVS